MTHTEDEYKQLEQFVDNAVRQSQEYRDVLMEIEQFLYHVRSITKNPVAEELHRKVRLILYGL